MSLLTEVRHFKTCDQYAGLVEALEIAKTQHCDVHLDVGVSGCGCITLNITEHDTFEQLQVWLKDGIEASNELLREKEIERAIRKEELEKLFREDELDELVKEERRVGKLMRKEERKRRRKGEIPCT